jgi:hypothetical protein
VGSAAGTGRRRQPGLARSPSVGQFSPEILRRV